MKSKTKDRSKHWISQRNKSNSMGLNYVWIFFALKIHSSCKFFNLELPLTFYGGLSWLLLSRMRIYSCSVIRKLNKYFWLHAKCVPEVSYPFHESFNRDMFRQTTNDNCHGHSLSYSHFGTEFLFNIVPSNESNPTYTWSFHQRILFDN